MVRIVLFMRSPFRGRAGYFVSMFSCIFWWQMCDREIVGRRGRTVDGIDYELGYLGAGARFARGADDDADFGGGVGSYHFGGCRKVVRRL